MFASILHIILNSLVSHNFLTICSLSPYCHNTVCVSDKLYVYPCEWNFRPDHCRYKNACPGAFNRIYMLHGNRQLFHKKDQRGMDGFITIYNTLEKHREGEDIHTSILEPLRQALPSYKADNTCNEMVSSMLASIEDTIHSMA